MGVGREREREGGRGSVSPTDLHSTIEMYGFA